MHLNVSLSQIKSGGIFTKRNFIGPNVLNFYLSEFWNQETEGAKLWTIEYAI